MLNPKKMLKKLPGFTLEKALTEHSLQPNLQKTPYFMLELTVVVSLAAQNDTDDQSNFRIFQTQKRREDQMA